MIYVPIVFVLIILSFVVQEFMPVFDWLFHARVMLVHTMFFCAAVTVPFPVMLLLALFTGFIWDARYYLPLGDDSELVFGFTVLMFGLAGAFIQGVRPLFRRGRWELPVFLIGLAAFGVLLLEYLILSFERGGLYFPGEIWFKMLMTALFTMALSPLFLLLLSLLAKKVGYKIRMEGITHRVHHGDTLST